MIQDIKEAIGKITKDRIVMGFDLSDEFSQISYMAMSDSEPKTVSTVVGGDQMCIPTKLGKVTGENTWTFGADAAKLEEEDRGTVISDLISKARTGKLVTVEGREYDPTDLLALYMKKCFSLLSLVAPIEKVSIIVITVDHPDSETIEILSRAITTLRIKPEKVFYQSHSESTYHYMIHQKKDLWIHDVLICHIKEDDLFVRTVKKNINTNPTVVMMEENSYRTVSAKAVKNGNPTFLHSMDQALNTILCGYCEDKYVSSIFLLGEGFEGDWYPESLKYMCKNRRVFGGNNLFSKGACYGAAEKLEESEVAAKHVFLGKDKVKANVGMKVMKEGEETYIALLDAGKNWYETSKECEFILDHEDTLNFIVTPLNGKNVKTVPMYLTGMPVRPPKATRIHMEMKMISERKLLVCVTDLGFGEFFAPSGQQWKSEIVLD